MRNSMIMTILYCLIFAVVVLIPAAQVMAYDANDLKDDLACTTTDDGNEGFNMVYYPPKTGEVNVVNYQYTYGHSRRYGAGASEDAATNATALQKAADSMNALGGGVVLVEDNLDFNSTLDFNGIHGVVIQGSTAYLGASLNYTGTGTAIMFGDSNTGGSQRCGMRDITLKSSGHTGAVGIYLGGTEASASVHNIFDNVRFEGFTAAYLEVNDLAFHNEFRSCVFHGDSSESYHPKLVLLNNARLVNFYDCLFENNRGYGIYADSSENINFFGGLFSCLYSSVDTASCAAWITGCKNMNFIGMFIEDVGGSIFTILGSSKNIVLSGNKFVDVHCNVTFGAVCFAGSSEGLVAIGNTFQGSSAANPVGEMYFISSSTRNVNIMGDVFIDINDTYRYENASTDTVNILTDDGMDIIKKDNYKPDHDIFGYQTRTFSQTANTTTNAYLIDADGDCMSGLIQVSATSASGEQASHIYVFNTDDSTENITELGTGIDNSGTISVSMDESGGDKRIKTTTGADWAATPTVSISVIVTASDNLDMAP
ncbi:MAG: hypothetical protein ABIG61_07055 [Planctomycetota bacterium]